MIEHGEQGASARVEQVHDGRAPLTRVLVLVIVHHEALLDEPDLAKKIRDEGKERPELPLLSLAETRATLCLQLL